MNKNQNAIDFEIDRLQARIAELKAENVRLRAALLEIGQLGKDWGAAPDPNTKGYFLKVVKIANEGVQ